jgi:purine-binding chemotaxis protein CheW
VASRYVHAVFQLVELVPLPGARSPVVGLTRWRGDVLTVLDLRRLVGLSVHALDDLGRVIVIGDAAAELGILADALDELRAVDPATLFPLSDRTADRAPDSAALVAGVTVDGVHMIDAAVLLARQREPVPSSAAGASSLAPLPPSTTAER